jgi:nucleoside-diphosphate-sugar epimerase
MRVLVIGGTRFVGAAIVEDLVSGGHAVSVFHTGRSEPEGFPVVDHVHGDRRERDVIRRALADAPPDAIVDTCAYSTADAGAVVDALATRPIPVVVLSSQDVYRAFVALRSGTAATDAVPIDETSPLRTPAQRYLFRGGPPMPVTRVDPDTYENLDVEEAYAEVRATVLRLPAVYGERDYIGREEPLLRRLRAGRRRIPIGAGTLLWSRGYVRDVAAAVRLALESPGAIGQTFNVAERRSWTMAQWAAKVLEVAGGGAELVPVPDDRVPDDLALTRAVPQHLLADSTRIRTVLGWTETDPDDALGRSVRWHLEHPPRHTGDDDFAADDRALG